MEQKQFDKLKQLDRIEYRQKEERIKKHFDGYSYDLFYTIAFLILVSLIFASIFGVNNYKDAAESFINFASVMLGILITIFIVILGLNIFDVLLENKHIKELQKEYFKVEVNK